jgi:hypothetical protein
MLTTYEQNEPNSLILLSDLKESKYLPDTEIEKVESFLKSDLKSYQYIATKKDNKTILSFTKQVDSKTIDIHVQGLNNISKIAYEHDPKHFKTHLSFEQLNNYLEGKAILVTRKLKFIDRNVFIQAIPKNYNRTSIKHLKLHPKQEYLIVSNDYLNIQANSIKCKIGGEVITDKEFNLIKNGFSIEKENPTFIHKGFLNEEVYKIQKFGTYDFSINLFNKKYKHLAARKPVIENEEIIEKIGEFIAIVKDTFRLDNQDTQRENLIDLFKNGKNVFIAESLNYYMNSTYIKTENQNNTLKYLYPFENGFTISISKTTESIEIMPSKVLDNAFNVNLIDSISLLYNLKKTKIIDSETYSLIKKTIENPSLKNDNKLNFKL